MGSVPVAGDPIVSWLGLGWGGVEGSIGEAIAEKAKTKGYNENL